MLVRVIDYKSGAAGFDLKMVHAGLQLQLAVYLNAALDLIQKEQKDKQIVPAGLFYFPMKDPMLESENSMEQEQIEQGLFRAMAMDGLVNEEEWIISKMDCEFEKRSDMIPVVKNKDGSFGRGSKTASTEDFMELGNFVKEKIHQMGQEIMEGRISLNPYKDGRKTACDYCSYGGICKFSQKESEFRRLEK